MIVLLVLHHIADVAFQPTWLIANKRKHTFAIYEHVMIYAGVLSAGLHWLGVFRPWMFVYFLAGHFLIDFTKYRIVPKRYGDHYWHVYVDQALHYAQILALAPLL